MAFIVTRELDLRSLVLHYEDYSKNFEVKTAELLEFMELRAVYEPPLFHANKSYREYFTEKERETVGRAIRIMSLRETWSHISRYFPETSDKI